MKQRYNLLDGLRGVAALMVIVYHLYECFPMESWIIGHGYLAVDFFFILSGFVIGYAYDDRWTTASVGVEGSLNKSVRRLTIGEFFRRRLIRLHPMVVFGVVWGLIAFLIQGGTDWSGNKATTSALMLATLLALFLIPNVPGASTEVRGNGEMYPLNGPHWSLFFEYIGNIMYALFIHRMSTRSLTLWTIVLGILFAGFGISDVVGYGNIGVGWTLDGLNFWGGLLRMRFSYSMGLLLCRSFKPMKIRGAFWICTLLIVVFLAVPNLGVVWVNCLYEVLCVMILFPIIVYMAASGKTTDDQSTAVCDLLGNLSYPLYAVHYPTMYLFYHFIGFPDTWRTPGECWYWMVLLLVGNIALAYLAWRFYDLPVRRWLSSKVYKK